MTRRINAHACTCAPALKRLPAHDAPRALRLLLAVVPRQVWGLVVSNPTTVVSCSWDRTIRVWDITNGSCVFELTGHVDRVRPARLRLPPRTSISAA
jgi:hypothetical protein